MEKDGGLPSFFLLLVGWLLLHSTQPSFAASPFTPDLQRAYQELLALKITHGRALAAHALKIAPTNAAGLLVANYADFLTLCLQQDEQAFPSLLAAQEERLRQLEHLPQTSDWVTYATAEVRLQTGLSKLLFGNRLAAAWDIRQAYLSFSENARRYPHFFPNKKTLGLLQVLIGSVPDNYKWFLSIIGMSGNSTEGLVNLKAATTTGNVFQEETQLYLALVLPLLDEEQYTTTSARQAAQLARKYPENLLYTFVATYLLKKARQGDAALALYQQRPNSTQYLSLPYLHHLAADLYLARGAYNQSVQENRLFLAQTKGQHYLKAAYFKLYLACLLHKQEAQAHVYFDKISKEGKAETEEDTYAQRFVERHEQLNRLLLLARLRSDGGYYLEAMAALNSLDTTKLPVPLQAEYVYRKARIYHGLRQLPQAITWYQRTISSYSNSGLYVVPHANLQLGYLYREAGAPEKAKVYFQQAMHYKGHEYKTSIDAKAKLALSNL
ncbi:tetratricopeptide repeat protein [Pontibacter chitinilyticus]|uniref:tetratricopeptide repeat protein n=1 Tax=Pontibacter chitinilyticus TaxID=2674989 RepID=UPI00321A3C10